MYKSHVQIFLEHRGQKIRYPGIKECNQILADLVIVIIRDTGLQSQVNVGINLAFNTASIKGVLIKVHGEYRYIYLNILYNLVCFFL